MSEVQKRYKIEGMTCAACSARLERVIAGLKGVNKVQVNLLAEKMHVLGTEELDQDEVLSTVEKAGFRAYPEEEYFNTRNFKVKGLTCEACVRRLENKLIDVPGVKSVTINLVNETARIVMDPDVSIEELVQETEKIGFTLEAGSRDVQEFDRELAERLRQLRQKTIVAMIFALPVLVVSMGEMLGLVLPEIINPHVNPLNFALTQFLLTLPILWSGRHFYINGFRNLYNLAPNMDSLIAIGTGAAVVYSTWNLAEIALGHSPFERAMDLYFESAAVIIALVSLGKFLEQRAKFRTSDAIKQLIKLRPETAVIEGGEGQKTLPVEDIRKGDIIIVRPGERIAVDGEVVQGSSAVDESMLTGESIPKSKVPGDKVYEGTLNTTGSVRFRADRVGSETALARIISMIQEAQGVKAPIASMVDRVSLYFVPVVIVFAFASGLGWFFLGESEFTFALRIFVAVLVIACPCALGLATPTAIMVGTGRGAQLGVLIKGGEVLEAAKNIQVVIFDKTGTLTRGKPELTDIILLDHCHEREYILSLLGGVEDNSEHPLARAMVEGLKKETKSLTYPDKFDSFPGKGVKAFKEGHEIIVGSFSWFQELMPQKVQKLKLDKLKQELSRQGKTPLLAAVDGSIVAVFGLADQLRPEVPEIVQTLKEQGIQVVMLTGDNETTAGAIAVQAGIEEVRAQVLPEYKAREVEKYQLQGYKVAMVGDGINDAPALTAADVGISMGTGIDVAIESGDIVLMKDSLEGVLTALGLSRATVRNIRQNLFWAFIYNVIGLPVAAGFLKLFGGPTLSPMFAGAAMALSSVSVVSNALRLRFFKNESTNKK